MALPTPRGRQEPGGARQHQHLFQQAVACFRRGDQQEASRLVQTILATDKRDFAALHLLGVIEAQSGRPRQAIGLLEQAVAVNPRSAEALNNLAIALHMLGRDQEAVARYQAALLLMPGYAIAHNNLGIALSSLGRRDEAIMAFRQALTCKPDYAEALNNLGQDLCAAGQFDEARALLTRALAIAPNYPEAAVNLGNALAGLGDREQAIRLFDKAIALRPGMVEAEIGAASNLNALRRYQDAVSRLQPALQQAPDLAALEMQLGIALAGLRRHDDARLHLERALLLQPDLIDADVRLGGVLSALDRHDDAIRRLSTIVAQCPDNPDARMQLGVAFALHHRHQEAIGHYDRALELRPVYPEAQVNLGRSLRFLERDAEALALFQAAVATRPDLAEAHDNLGLALAESGRIDEACLAFDAAITRDPTQPNFYLNRINARGFASDAPQQAALDALVGRMEDLSPADQMVLHFALGKLLADRGEQWAAFKHLLRGNAMKRDQIAYDEQAALGRMAHTITAFTPDLMQRFSNCGEPSDAPVFILGLPRSGSTLVEQILAGHPRVFAGGERRDFRDAMRITSVEGQALRFPSGMATAEPAQLQALGAGYVARLRMAAARGGADGLAGAAAETRITDKMPANFRFAGLIHLALPNARIIHTVRDPVDTCLSCFSILFGGNQPFAYDLGELGRYYRGYRQLMDHWRGVLPPGVMLDVKYEDLVGNFATEAARIVAHCGLEWDDRCLSFAAAQRPVRTASMSQVRQPLYNSAIGRWRLDAEVLRPLLQGLGIEPATVG